jgi:hypothetical protein
METATGVCHFDRPKFYWCFPALRTSASTLSLATLSPKQRAIGMVYDEGPTRRMLEELSHGETYRLKDLTEEETRLIKPIIESYGDQFEYEIRPASGEGDYHILVTRNDDPNKMRADVYDSNKTTDFLLLPEGSDGDFSEVPSEKWLSLGSHISLEQPT